MTVAERAVPRKKSGRSSKPMRVDASIKMKIEMIAADRGIDEVKYASDILRGPVERDWLKIVQRKAEEDSAGRPPS